MSSKRQFSLGYLFLEIFWIALALGLTTQVFRLDDEAAIWFSAILLLLAAQAWGAAVGGLFQRMKTGFLMGSAIMIGGLAVLGGMMLVSFFNRLARGH
jgi:hypothetical protein